MFYFLSIFEYHINFSQECLLKQQNTFELTIFLLFRMNNMLSSNFCSPRVQINSNFCSPRVQISSNFRTVVF